MLYLPPPEHPQILQVLTLLMFYNVEKSNCNMFCKNWLHFHSTGFDHLPTTFFYTEQMQHVLSPQPKKHVLLPSSLLTSKLCGACWWQTLSCRGQNSLLSCLNASCASVLVHKLCISRINLTATQIYEEKSRLCITLSSQSV